MLMVAKKGWKVAVKMLGRFWSHIQTVQLFNIKNKLLCSHSNLDQKCYI